MKKTVQEIKKKFLLHQTRNIILVIISCVFLIALAILVSRTDLFAQVFRKNPQLDRSKPVPSKDEIVKVWQKRQDAIKTFRFAWTEQQTHPKGWLSNPRFPQREWSNIPGLSIDRSYAVPKTLTVDGAKMRYSFEIDRKEEADGVRVASNTGDNKGLGLGRHYLYVSTFDGVIGKWSLDTVKTPEARAGTKRTSENEFPEPLNDQSTANIDAQNLDTRAILMAFRPLDPAMGHTRVDRAVTNLVRTIYEGKSTFLLEESHDPSGWKMILRIEPERDFIVRQFMIFFEQKLIAEINIDYVEDTKWGWIPSGWQISQMLDDGSTRLLSEAKVTSYNINEPIANEAFQIKTE
jgi:hypothetical protein